MIWPPLMEGQQKLQEGHKLAKMIQNSMGGGLPFNSGDTFLIDRRCFLRVSIAPVFRYPPAWVAVILIEETKRNGGDGWKSEIS